MRAVVGRVPALGCGHRQAQLSLAEVGYRCVDASSTGRPRSSEREHMGWTMVYWLHKIKDTAGDYSELNGWHGVHAHSLDSVRDGHHRAPG